MPYGMLKLAGTEPYELYLSNHSSDGRYTKYLEHYWRITAASVRHDKQSEGGLLGGHKVDSDRVLN